MTFNSGRVILVPTLNLPIFMSNIFIFFSIKAGGKFKRKM